MRIATSPAAHRVCELHECLFASWQACAASTQPGDFVHVIGDAHVYLNHVDALRIQLAREPRPFPTLRIDREVAEIDDFKFSDFVVEGYKPDKSIKMKMAV